MEPGQLQRGSRAEMKVLFDLIQKGQIKQAFSFANHYRLASEELALIKLALQIAEVL